MAAEGDLKTTDKEVCVNSIFKEVETLHKKIMALEEEMRLMAGAYESAFEASPEHSPDADAPHPHPASSGEFPNECNGPHN